MPTESLYRIEDTNTVEEARSHAALIRSAGNWLAKQHWQLFMHLDFRFNVDDITAETAIRRYVSALGQRAYGFAGVEEGPIAGRTHAHILLGGLNALPYEVVRRAWRMGPATGEHYNPRMGGAHYAAKFPETTFVIGTCELHHPTHRGQRGSGRSSH